MAAERTRKLQSTLRRVFGHEALRPGQREVIERAIAQRDTLAIMPTGAGKSLCYQLPALLLPGTTVVVSPLISLMKDQADKLSDIGIEAQTVNSSLDAGAEREALRRIVSGDAEFVFTTPERLAQPDFRKMLKRAKIDLLVIDEAHCISRWGHDFRPAYLEIGRAMKALGNPAILALTATAPAEVIDDIRRTLDRPRMGVVDIGVYRPNLAYAVRQVTNRDEKAASLLALLTDHDGAAIVYTATVKAAGEVCAMLAESGIEAMLYHGRLAAAKRSQRQDAFMSGRVRVMVATNAFGMGIDKADIRSVVHWQVPGSIEAYYQESGRAGRDGEDAWCTLIYDHDDRRVQQFFLAGHVPAAEELRRVHAGDTGDLAKGRVQRARAILDDAGFLDRRDVPGRDFEALAARELALRAADREKLERMTAYAHSAQCRWKAILEAFEEGAADGFERCGRCDNCLGTFVQ